MKLLLHYLKEHKWLVVLALFLAAMNIGFSLMDPAITGKLMDRYITKAHLYKSDKNAYIMGVLELIGYAIG
ncbi:MAG: ABC transporter ATP-binding protein, partial [Bacteroidia bacterium]